MTVTVTCRSGCRDDRGDPRQWRENCQECADSIAATHRTETGHDVEVHRSTSLRDMLADPTYRNMFRKRGA